MKKSGDTRVVLETHLENLGPKKQGKVRDIYDLGEQLLLVATDRISAFDVILPDGIPGKGYVLTQMSRFWFEWLYQMEDMVPHHLITTAVAEFPEPCQNHAGILEGRSMLVRKVSPLPVECIVRGCLSGSAWREYRESGQVCSQILAKGLLESAQLSEPIFTPSSKATEGHDINISFEQMETMVGKAVANDVREASLKIYQRAAAFAASRGILIADTKFEFGLDPETGQLTLIDEVLTPDSSRFWPKDTFATGRPQPSFDKQYVRDYLDSIGWHRRPPAPKLPEEVILQTSLKYREALERITRR